MNFTDQNRESFESREAERESLVIPRRASDQPCLASVRPSRQTLRSAQGDKRPASIPGLAWEKSSLRPLESISGRLYGWSATATGSAFTGSRRSGFCEIAFLSGPLENVVG